MPLTRVRTGGIIDDAITTPKVNSSFALSASMMPSGTILQTKTISSTDSKASSTNDTFWLDTNAVWQTSEQHGIALTTKKANSIFNCFISQHVYYVQANGNAIVTQYTSIGHSTSSTSGYSYTTCAAEYYDSRSGDTSLPNQRQNTPTGGISFSLSHAAGTTVYFAVKSIYGTVGNENGQNFTVHEVSA